MEFINADRVTSRLESSTQRGELVWRQRKIRGTFRHNWDLRNFPFDRQTLTIAIEEGVSQLQRAALRPRPRWHRLSRAGAS